VIEQPTIDCYNDSEQITGLFTMIEEHLALPFQTTVLGATVTVARVDVTASDEIIAICKRDGTGKRSRSSTYRFPRQHPTARNGSRHNADGSACRRAATLDHSRHRHHPSLLTSCPRRWTRRLLSRLQQHEIACTEQHRRVSPDNAEVQITRSIRTSAYTEIIHTVHERPAPMVPATPRLVVRS
jgi:hypothetical protein